MRHCRYFNPSHTAHATVTMPTIAAVYFCQSLCWLPSTRIRMIASGMPVRMFREKYHQCGRRSSATVSPSWTRLSGYAMRERLRPAELAEAHLVHAEVVPDLVQHGHADLRGEGVEVTGASRQRALEDRDAIGCDAAVAERP